MDVYTPSSDKIIHKTSVDFSKRMVSDRIHIVQFDNTLPIIAVSLFSNYVPYKIPSVAEVRIKTRKPDDTFVSRLALGWNAERNVAYFEVSEQMTIVDGLLSPIIEIKIGTMIAASGSIEVEIDKNPVPKGEVDSTDEGNEIERYVDTVSRLAAAASNAADAASASASSVFNCVEQAASSADSARQSAELAVESWGNLEKNLINIDYLNRDQYVTGRKIFKNSSGITVDDGIASSTLDGSSLILNFGYSKEYLTLSKDEITLTKSEGASSVESISFKFPSESGTIAILEKVVSLDADQTITGKIIFENVSGVTVDDGGASSTLNGASLVLNLGYSKEYLTLSANGISLTQCAGFMSVGSKQFTFPKNSGQLATLEDLSSRERASLAFPAPTEEDENKILIVRGGSYVLVPLKELGM